jgi:radical SAM superfamily enzyme YgiQ (UPF0313 family)
MYPLYYIDPVFRPPSEAGSLILQVTNGCSWNKCTFCEMYTQEQKRFRPKDQKTIEQELDIVARSGQPVRRIFLADGDAMTLSYRRLKAILVAINNVFPDINRISSYCLPRNLKNKTVEQLTELRAMGLSLMYVGCETGDDLLLGKVNKGETFLSSLDALQKIKQAGMKSSVMILNGLGGIAYSQQHAINSARLMNEAQPEYLSTLVLSFPAGMKRYQAGFDGEFVPLDQRQLFEEMQTLLGHLELKKTIFRSDHASNYLVLKGTLNQDKAMLLEKINRALNNPKSVPLRQEWQRGL